MAYKTQVDYTIEILEEADKEIINLYDSYGAGNEELIRSLDAWQVNDHLAYITRMWGIELAKQEELEHYEKDSLDT